MLLRTTTLIALTALLGMSSCSKDRIEEPELNEYSDMNEYLDSKKQEEQVFTVDSTGDGPLVGQEGTQIYGGKDLLMHANGDSVEWPFTVTLVELYPAYDMMYWQVPTVSAGQMMETRGEIRIKAYKDGEELVLRPGAAFTIYMPSDDPKSGMKVFDGNDDGSNWTLDASYSFTDSDSGHVALIDDLGWINCGAIASDGTGAVISFTSEVDDLTNVKIFIYASDTRTVMQVNNLESYPIPEGTHVDIVCMAIDGEGLLYSFDKTITVSGNESIDVTLSEISDANLTALLEGL